MALVDAAVSYREGLVIFIIFVMAICVGLFIRFWIVPMLTLEGYR